MRKLHWVSVVLLAVPLTLSAACSDDEDPVQTAGSAGTPAVDGSTSDATDTDGSGGSDGGVDSDGSVATDAGVDAAAEAAASDAAVEAGDAASDAKADVVTVDVVTLDVLTGDVVVPVDVAVVVPVDAGAD